ncbi:MAG: 2-oxoacid:acceptor oxidoreductase family protein [Desulfatirhabdiaceae bacterium]|nr:2-oxoacid:acceptor oxidoreductase family protein [Desulfatirhabdiaceae bacterium]
MKAFNIYLTGVGGQGIGLMSEILLRAADHAGFPVKGVDTHGLAQRGGIVVSQIRIGGDVHSPLIRQGKADLIIALERHEAFRGIAAFLKDGGIAIYYDTVWQPLPVRLNQAPEVDNDTILAYCSKRNIQVIRVLKPGLSDARMQNIAVLAGIHENHLIPGIEFDHFKNAMSDLMEGAMLEKNLALMDEILS